jgi:CRP-like cAMP-binding protein
MKPELERVEIGRLELIQTMRRVFGQQHGLSTAALAAMAAHVVGVRIPAGFELNDPGEQMADVYLVTEGELATEYQGRLLHLFGPHTVVGLLASLIRGSRGFRCWASRETLALSWRADDMQEVFEDHFELLHSVLRAMASESIELRRQLPPHAGFSNVIRSEIEYPARPLDLVERLLCLRHTFGLQTSHIDELAELARAAVESRYPAGTPLWAAGESSDALLIMVRGVVSGTTPEGLEFQLGPGDIVGGLGVVAGLPGWFSARVTQPALTLSINREVLIDLLEDQPDLGFDFLHLMASALLELRVQIAELSADAPARAENPAVRADARP